MIGISNSSLKLKCDKKVRLPFLLTRLPETHVYIARLLVLLASAGAALGYVQMVKHLNLKDVSD